MIGFIGIGIILLRVVHQFRVSRRIGTIRYARDAYVLMECGQARVDRCSSNGREDRDGRYDECGIHFRDECDGREDVRYHDFCAVHDFASGDHPQMRCYA